MASLHSFPSQTDADGSPTQRTFVFKVYHNEKHEASYEDERNALQRLSANPSPNLVKFYGSLRQLGSSCLILEYVDGGNLGDFFDNCDRPPTVDDVVMFWKSLFQVFAGLDRIHQSISNEDKTIMG
jgi:serine/threonine protein kinase